MTDLSDPIPDSLHIVVKKKEFVDRVVARSGVKKADARAVIDATLSTLADALQEGGDLVLPPLGRLKVTRTKDVPRGKQLILKLSLPKIEESASQGLAEDEDTD